MDAKGQKVVLHRSAGDIEPVGCRIQIQTGREHILWKHVSTEDLIVCNGEGI